MIKGALFTIGILMLVGGLGFGALGYMAAGMSDAPNSDENAQAIQCARLSFGVAFVGAVVIAGAFLL